MSDAHNLTCPACRALDQSDGVEDGRLYPAMAERVKDERRIVLAVRRAA